MVYCRETEYFGWVSPSELTKVDARAVLSSLTLSEAKQLGISPETYSNLTKVEELRWKPKRGEKYYFIDSSGNVEFEYWFEDSTDQTRYKVSNCYQWSDNLDLNRHTK